MDTGHDGAGVRRSGPASAAVHDHMAAGLKPGDHARTVRSLMLALRAIVAADGQQPEPSSREQESASASSTRRSLPEVGEFAHTQFITAMLIAPAPRMSGSGSRMGAASSRQVRSDAVYDADR